MARSLIYIGAVVLLASATQAQEQPSGARYSTCPDNQHALVRSVVYNEASESDLRKWATMKPNPKRSTRPEAVHVQIQVEGEGVFCARAMDGPAEKQKAAVSSAMAWRFKKNRGDFNNNVIGELTFMF